MEKQNNTVTLTQDENGRALVNCRWSKFDGHYDEILTLLAKGLIIFLKRRKKLFSDYETVVLKTLAYIQKETLKF